MCMASGAFGLARLNGREGPWLTTRRQSFGEESSSGVSCGYTSYCNTTVSSAMCTLHIGVCQAGVRLR